MGGAAGSRRARCSSSCARGLLARPELARALAGDVAEGAPERAQALQPVWNAISVIGQVGVAQQRRRPLDAPREQVAVRRHAEGLLERSREVGLGDAAHARQPPDRPLLVRGGVHPVLRAQQAAQQLGVLEVGRGVRFHSIGLALSSRSLLPAPALRSSATSCSTWVSGLVSPLGRGGGHLRRSPARSAARRGGRATARAALAARSRRSAGGRSVRAARSRRPRAPPWRLDGEAAALEEVGVRLVDPAVEAQHDVRIADVLDDRGGLAARRARRAARSTAARPTAMPSTGSSSASTPRSNSKRRSGLRV